MKKKQNMGVYLIWAKKTGLVKIGVTENIQKRMSQLVSGNADEIHLVEFFPISFAYYHEGLLHEQYAERRIHHEWFRLSRKDVQAISEYLRDAPEPALQNGDQLALL